MLHAAEGLGRQLLQQHMRLCGSVPRRLGHLIFRPSQKPGATPLPCFSLCFHKHPQPPPGLRLRCLSLIPRVRPSMAQVSHDLKAMLTECLDIEQRASMAHIQDTAAGVAHDVGSTAAHATHAPAVAAQAMGGAGGGAGDGSGAAASAGAPASLTVGTDAAAVRSAPGSRLAAGAGSALASLVPHGPQHTASPSSLAEMAAANFPMVRLPSQTTRAASLTGQAGASPPSLSPRSTVSRTGGASQLSILARKLAVKRHASARVVRAAASNSGASPSANQLRAMSAWCLAEQAMPVTASMSAGANAIVHASMTTGEIHASLQGHAGLPVISSMYGGLDSDESESAGPKSLEQGDGVSLSNRLPLPRSNPSTSQGLMAQSPSATPGGVSATLPTQDPRASPAQPGTSLGGAPGAAAGTSAAGGASSAAAEQGPRGRAGGPGSPKGAAAAAVTQLQQQQLHRQASGGVSSLLGVGLPPMFQPGSHVHAGRVRLTEFVTSQASVLASTLKPVTAAPLGAHAAAHAGQQQAWHEGHEKEGGL